MLKVVVVVENPVVLSVKSRKLLPITLVLALAITTVPFDRTDILKAPAVTKSILLAPEEYMPTAPVAKLNAGLVKDPDPILKLPELSNNIKVLLPDVTWKDDVDCPTDAVAEPVAICDKFSPVIPEAGMLYKLAPDPEKDPSVKRTVDPVILTLPVKV